MSQSALLLLMCAASTGQSTELREVDGNTITSAEVPAARLTLDPALDYVGGQSFLLGETTRAEQHLYVESDADQRIRRVYWIQFEGRIDRSGRPYDYSADDTVEHEGITFHTSYRYYPPSGFAGPKGSDGDRARELLESRGYSFGPDLGRLRLVWLLGEPPLDEVMIIYVEDLEPHGLTVEGLEAEPARWEVFREGLLRRALEGLTIRRLE